MPTQNDDNQSWPLSALKLIVYLIIGLGVGYAIAHYWSPSFHLNQY